MTEPGRTTASRAARRYLADQTFGFVAEHLPPGRRRVLEVGAGTGELAELLFDAGIDVTALDSSADAVAAARRRGVPARRVHWPDFDEHGFDAILFTRSLHHMEHLDRALEAAAAVLRQPGRILIEDFAFADADAATIAWLCDLLARLRADGLVAPDPDVFAGKLLGAEHPQTLWHRDSHHIHPARAIRAAVERVFELEASFQAPYLYRYVAPILRDEASAREVLQTVQETERAAASAGEIRLIGRRLVGAAP